MLPVQMIASGGIDLTSLGGFLQALASLATPIGGAFVWVWKNRQAKSRERDRALKIAQDATDVAEKHAEEKDMELLRGMTEQRDYWRAKADAYEKGVFPNRDGKS